MLLLRKAYDRLLPHAQGMDGVGGMSELAKMDGGKLPTKFEPEAAKARRPPRNG